MTRIPPPSSRPPLLIDRRVVTLPNGRQGVRVPKYDPNDQIHSAQAFTHLSHEVISQELALRDQDQFLVGCEILRAMREIGQLARFNAFRLLGLDRPGLDWAIDNTDRSVGIKFDAHGIAKGTPYELLDKLLTEGIRKDRTFYSMSFINAGRYGGAFGADRPFTSGGIIVVSDFGQLLIDAGIKYVILGEEYNRLIDFLRKKYPQVEIVPWHDAPRVLAMAAMKATGQNYQIPELTEENWPVYLLPSRRIRP